MVSKNVADVKVRQDRVCAICGRKIGKGSFCRTVNKLNRGRKWVCMSCVEHIDELESLSNSLGANFDDEGYALACQDMKFECESELEECYEKLGVCDRY